MPGRTALRRDLQIDENEGFQARTWRLQRIGWAIGTIVLVAALLGLFAGGILSRTATVAEDGSISVTYERFARLQTPTSFTVEASAVAGEAGQLAISLDYGYLADVEVGTITPPPLQVELAGNRAVHLFAVGAGAETVRITFHITPQRMGTVRATVRREPDGQPVDISHFVYP